ncbi:hypothetical protein V8G54_026900 [Vigna mungo]|uniref:Uncharacterized protein n=1 Tax=Vigna mungo TaxID=3915 RepID=A0AAQ3N1W0_VIGMU
MVEDGKVVFSQSKKQCSRTTLHIYIITTTYAVWFSYVVVFHFTCFPTARKLCVSIQFHDTRDVTLKEIEIKGSRNWVSRVDGWRCCKPTTTQIKVLACLNLNTWLLRKTSHVL